MASKGAEFIELNIDPDTLPVKKLELATWLIEQHNAQLWDELRVNGHSDLKRWFIMDHEKGKFVAEIVHAGGGGRSSRIPEPEDYCDLHIAYELHYRIEG